MWVRGVRSVVRGVRGRDERGVGRQPGGRVRRVVVVVQLRVVVERRHAVHAAAAAVHSSAFTSSSSSADSSGVNATYSHCGLGNGVVVVSPCSSIVIVLFVVQRLFLVTAVSELN